MTKTDYTIAAGILELPHGECIPVNSPSWWDWVESAQAVAFTFNCDHGIKNYRARKEEIKGKSGKFWYAYKRHDKTLRKRYIGKSEELSLEKLEAIAYDLLTPPKARESQPQLPTELPNEVGEYRELLNEARRIAIQRESDFERMIAQKVEVCKENQELKEQLQLLHTQVGNNDVNLRAELEEELLDLQTENMRLQEENAKLKQKFEGLPEREQEMREEINRLMRVQLENDTLKAWNRDLRTALENNPSPKQLLKEYETRYETVKSTLPKPPKEVTRNWVEFWRFKSWLSTRLER